VSDVLIMTAREFGDPVAELIDVKACDYTFHDWRPIISPGLRSLLGEYRGLGFSVRIVLFYTRESNQSTHPLRLTRFRPRRALSVIRPATTCFATSPSLTDQSASENSPSTYSSTTMRSVSI